MIGWRRQLGKETSHLKGTLLPAKTSMQYFDSIIRIWPDRVSLLYQVINPFLDFFRALLVKVPGVSLEVTSAKLPKQYDSKKKNETAMIIAVIALKSTKGGPPESVLHRLMTKHLPLNGSNLEMQVDPAWWWRMTESPYAQEGSYNTHIVWSLQCYRLHPHASRSTNLCKEGLGVVDSYAPFTTRRHFRNFTWMQCAPKTRILFSIVSNMLSRVDPFSYWKDHIACLVQKGGCRFKMQV